MTVRRTVIFTFEWDKEEDVATVSFLSAGRCAWCKTKVLLKYVDRPFKTGDGAQVAQAADVKCPVCGEVAVRCHVTTVDKLERDDI